MFVRIYTIYNKHISCKNNNNNLENQTMTMHNLVMKRNSHIEYLFLTEEGGINQFPVVWYQGHGVKGQVGLVIVLQGRKTPLGLHNISI